MALVLMKSYHFSSPHSAAPSGFGNPILISVRLYAFLIFTVKAERYRGVTIPLRVNKSNKSRVSISS